MGATAPVAPPGFDRWEQVIVPGHVGGATDLSIHDVVRQGAVRTVYQPIVDLRSGAVVAAEALSRGPSGTYLERPDHLFAAAAEAGLTTRLDQLCMQRALRAGRASAGALSLFVNAEPTTLAVASTARLLSGLGDRLVVEVTERQLDRDPAGLLRCLDHVRAIGARVALDDLGADPTSTAFLAFVRPDILKLDMALIQGRPSRLIAQTATAVMAYAESHHATILAEGIETESQLRRALALGAELGQGYLLGRPQPVLPHAGAGEGVMHRRSPWAPIPAELTPFHALEQRRVPTRVADIALLLEISKHLEGQAAAQNDLVLLAAFQDAERFTPHTAARYTALARRLPFVAALGVGLPASPAPGVRGANLREDDPLRGEWAVIALSPHYAGALIARDLGDDGPRLNRRFEYAVTHDRALVTVAALATMNRVARQGDAFGSGD
jgi:EAL domain-containing protein (putative c-di-GMP-specific phosphodiesterase class I)